MLSPSAESEAETSSEAPQKKRVAAKRKKALSHSTDPTVDVAETISEPPKKKVAKIGPNNSKCLNCTI